MTIQTKLLATNNNINSNFKFADDKVVESYHSYVSETSEQIRENELEKGNEAYRNQKKIWDEERKDDILKEKENKIKNEENKMLIKEVYGEDYFDSPSEIVQKHLIKKKREMKLKENVRLEQQENVNKSQHRSQKVAKHSNQIAPVTNNNNILTKRQNSLNTNNEYINQETLHTDLKVVCKTDNNDNLHNNHKVDFRNGHLEYDNDNFKNKSESEKSRNTKRVSSCKSNVRETEGQKKTHAQIETNQVSHNDIPNKSEKEKSRKHRCRVRYTYESEDNKNNNNDIENELQNHLQNTPQLFSDEQRHIIAEYNHFRADRLNDRIKGIEEPEREPIQVFEKEASIVQYNCVEEQSEIMSDNQNMYDPAYEYMKQQMKASRMINDQEYTESEYIPTVTDQEFLRYSTTIESSEFEDKMDNSYNYVKSPNNRPTLYSRYYRNNAYESEVASNYM